MTCEDNFKTWADSHGPLATLEMGCCLTYPHLQHLASSMFPGREEDGAGDSYGEARIHAGESRGTRGVTEFEWPGSHLRARGLV